MLPRFAIVCGAVVISIFETTAAFAQAYRLPDDVDFEAAALAFLNVVNRVSVAGGRQESESIGAV